MANTPLSQPETERTLLNHYRLITLDGLGLQEVPLALTKAAGGLLNYLRDDTNPLLKTSMSASPLCPWNIRSQCSPAMP